MAVARAIVRIRFLLQGQSIERLDLGKSRPLFVDNDVDNDTMLGI
jgi:hypothetical protein